MTETPSEREAPPRPALPPTDPSAGFLAREVVVFGTALTPASLGLTLSVGVGGALLAGAVGTPLPWMFGSLLGVAGAALGGLRAFGRAPAFPTALRFFFVPLVGVAIGGQFSSDLLAEAGGWWLTLAALALYLPLAHGVGFFVYRRLAGYDRATALFAAMPGGLVEAVAMGEGAGGHAATLTLLQFSRLVLCILTVPLAIALYEGAPVGSAAGLALGEGETAPGPLDWVLLLGAAAAGAIGGRRLGLPAAIITGPILVSGAIHLAGLTDADPPGWLIALTQLVVGMALGVRFAGMERGAALAGLGWAALALAGGLALAFAAALLLGALAGLDPEAVLLAYAPGGVSEMSLVALSLDLSVVFVTAHHVARLLLIVTLVVWVHRWLRRHRGWP